MVGGGGRLSAATASLAPTVLRDWWLLVALPLAYWAPARLAGTPNERLERWLQSIDDRLGLTRPDPAGHGLLEFAYFLVYPMVPAGLLAITFSNPGMAAEFWLVLFAAVLPCYGLLPLIPTRPPRAFLLPAPPAGSAPRLFRRANVTFLATFGNTWNTLPSGHAAGAAAVAVMVWRSGSPIGASLPAPGPRHRDGDRSWTVRLRRRHRVRRDAGHRRCVVAPVTSPTGSQTSGLQV